MSRAYRIRVSESLKKHVQIDDGIKAPLEILPVLPAGRMRAILAAELEERGFTVEGSIARREEEEGVVLEVDLEAGEISLKIERKEEVNVSATATATPNEQKKDQGRSELKDQVHGQLERAADRAQERLRQEATERLEKRLGDLRSELDSVINRVTAEALKERARQLGEIEELAEDQETGSLTIKVRL